MGLYGGRGGDRGSGGGCRTGFCRRAARGAERRGRAPGLARGVTVGACWVTLELRRVGDGEPRGHHAGEAAGRPRGGKGRGSDRPPRGKGTWAVENQTARGHVRWGRGLFGERAFRGGWLPAGGGEAAWLRPSAAFEEGAAVAPEVPPTGG